MYRYNMLQKVSPAKDRQMSDVYVVVNNAKFWYGSCVRRNMKLLADFTTRTAFPRRKFAVPLSRSKYCTIRAIDFPLSVASDLTIRHINMYFISVRSTGLVEAEEMEMIRFCRKQWTKKWTRIPHRNANTSNHDKRHYSFCAICVIRLTKVQPNVGQDHPMDHHSQQKHPCRFLVLVVSHLFRFQFLGNVFC